MDVSSATQSSVVNSQQTAGTDRGATTISSDFETFIKMLTVQMENQDPLNPVEGADFAVQLATFSNVEQAVLTNNLLTSLSEQIGAQSVSQLSGWVGMEARVVMPVEFSGSPVKLSLNPDNQADTAELVVKNAQGVEVARESVPLDVGGVDWAGVDDQGNPLPYGTYEISVESFSGDEVLSSRLVEVHSKIVEARNENGAPALLMGSGQTVSASQILGLSNPST